MKIETLVLNELSPELEKFYRELKISDDQLSEYRLPFCRQAELSDLEVVDLDFAGRPFILAKPAADAWRVLVATASAGGVRIMPASGFRSYLYQYKLIESRLVGGEHITGILTSNTLPGFSEHHTGFAADICTDPLVPEDRFHETDVFAWMTTHAHEFGFSLSYPSNNEYGLIFEPWHWRFKSALNSVLQ